MADCNSRAPAGRLDAAAGSQPADSPPAVEEPAHSGAALLGAQVIVARASLAVAALARHVKPFGLAAAVLEESCHQLDATAGNIERNMRDLWRQ